MLIWSTFSREATNVISSTFLNEATRAVDRATVMFDLFVKKTTPGQILDMIPD